MRGYTHHRIFSSLLQLDEDAGAVFRVEEDDGLVVRSDPGLLAQTADPFRLESRHGVLNVVHLDADVVETARLVLVQVTLWRNNNV